MAEEKEKNTLWEFDFTKWDLNDVMAFEESKSTRERLPLMQKALLRSPYGDLTNEADRAKINPYQWQEIGKVFADKVKEIFQ